jgi:hypothetical protein
MSYSFLIVPEISWTETKGNHLPSVDEPSTNNKVYHQYKQVSIEDIMLLVDTKVDSQYQGRAVGIKRRLVAGEQVRYVMLNGGAEGD